MSVPQVDGFNKLMDMAPGRVRDIFYVSLYNYTTPNASRLLMINTALKTSGVLGEFGHPVRQLALDSLHNMLYGVGGQPNVPGLGNADENLYLVDMLTGAATLIGPFDPVNNSIRKMVGLGYDWETDTIYGTDSLRKQLFTINKATGQATLVGSTGVCIFDIYSDPDTVWVSGSHMYGVGSPNGQLPFYFYPIDLATGLATQISPLAPRKWTVRKRDSRTQEKGSRSILRGQNGRKPGWLVYQSFMMAALLPLKMAYILTTINRIIWKV